MTDMLRIGADFETYYDSECSLSKLPVEEYLTHPNFHVLGCAFMVGRPSNMAWLWPEQLEKFLSSIDWSKVELVGHNLQFDGAILAWRYGVKPAVYLDTMALASRHVVPFTGKASLAATAEYLHLPAKGDTVHKMKGIGLAEVRASPAMADELCRYALHDIWLSWQIADKWWPTTPPVERELISWTVRNSLTPRLDLDVPLIQQHLAETMATRQMALDKTGIEPSQLRSTKLFAEHLADLGVQVEYKNGKQEDVLIPCVAKDDPFMQRLLQHEDEAVRGAAEARLAWSSNLEVTRSERFLRHAQVTGGQLMVSLRYWAAHTGRFGGANRMNLQNLGRKSILRRAIRAKPGRKLVMVDASQIEARLVAWVAGVRPLLGAFRDGRDPYCEFGSGFYGYPLNREDHPVERQISKVTVLQLGYGSGAAKLFNKLTTANVPVDEADARDIVDYYRREAYPDIPKAWYKLDELQRRAIETAEEQHYQIHGTGGPARYITFTPDRLILPSGSWLYYPELHIDSDDQIVYYSPRYKSWQKLYGGALMENVCQAMARELIASVHAWLAADVVLQVHDELVQEVPAERAEYVLAETIAAMSHTPDWAVGLPLSAEGAIGDYYGKN